MRPEERETAKLAVNRLLDKGLRRSVEGVATSPANLETKKSGAFLLRPGEFPGRVLLSRDAFGHSTIGAEGLNCRVRDGNGCFTFAMATGNLARS
jgi:hypothetical protein